MATRQNPHDRRTILRVADTGPYPLDESSNCSIAITYSGDEIDYIEKTVDGETFRKTFTYTSGKVTAITAWVLQ